MFAGGLTKHIGAVTALSCPTVNCYRRLHTPWAPDVANWGLNDRMATFRVKSYSPKVVTVQIWRVRFTRAAGRRRSGVTSPLAWGEVGEVSHLNSLAQPAHANQTRSLPSMHQFGAKDGIAGDTEPHFFPGDADRISHPGWCHEPVPRHRRDTRRRNRRHQEQTHGASKGSDW